MTAPEFAPVLISRREIESLERIERLLKNIPGNTMDWATLLVFITSAKEVHFQAEGLARRLERAETIATAKDWIPQI
jgi:hypothetical protein